MSQGWIDTIAKESGTDPEEAAAILRKRGVSASFRVRPAHKLRILSISFSGIKDGLASGDIAFDWNGLGEGVWALTSYGANLVGKSTVLEVILWCLRGEVKGLQDDVRHWLRKVRTELAIDGTTYIVEFDVLGGAPSGDLSRIRPDGRREVVDRFSSSAGFKVTMERFMLNALDLDPIPSQQGKDEAAVRVENGWSALSGAMYFGGEHGQLLGDVFFGGLPARLLQVFVGMPWAETVIQASAGLKDANAEGLRAGKAEDLAAAARAAARDRIQGELAAARKRLESHGDEGDAVSAVAELAERHVRNTAERVDLERMLSDAEDEFRHLKGIADEDERAARNLRETAVAAAFFNGLKPSCCPRCEVAVPKERLRREATDMTCSICSEEIPPERLESLDEQLEEAERRRAATGPAAERAWQAVLSTRALLQKAKTEQERSLEALQAAPRSTALRERRDAEIEVARLEGALHELSAATAAIPVAGDGAVLKAAHAVAKGYMDSAGAEILSAVSAELGYLARRLGIVQLEEVSLNAQAQLAVRKGGQRTTFSKLSPGERLRLRLATVLALLRVGKRLGIGRHPGLILIDSPAAEETDESDLETFLSELRAVTEDDGDLQVFIASANGAKVVPAVGEARCRVNADGGYLW